MSNKILHTATLGTNHATISYDPETEELFVDVKIRKGKREAKTEDLVTFVEDVAGHLAEIYMEMWLRK